MGLRAWRACHLLLRGREHVWKGVRRKKRITLRVMSSFCGMTPLGDRMLHAEGS